MAQGSQNPESPSADRLDAFKQTWRYKFGLLLIIGGHGVLLASVVLPFLGLMSASAAAAGVVGGEILSLVSIVFLGKQGFLAIKAKVFGVVRAEFETPVGRVRHTIGIALLLVNLCTAVTLAIFAWASYEAAPGAIVWGMTLGQQVTFYATFFLVGELSFPVAIIVLGADWWQRFRDLFIWHPHPE